MNGHEVAERIENGLTQEDVEAWHNGELTAHVEQLMSEFDVDELQIWGSHDGNEPLSVIVGFQSNLTHRGQKCHNGKELFVIFG